MLQNLQQKFANFLRPSHGAVLDERKWRGGGGEVIIDSDFSRFVRAMHPLDRPLPAPEKRMETLTSRYLAEDADLPLEGRGEHGHNLCQKNFAKKRVGSRESRRAPATWSRSRNRAQALSPAATSKHPQCPECSPHLYRIFKCQKCT